MKDEDYIGMTRPEAIEKAHEQGHSDIRLIPEGHAWTAELRPLRLNMELDDRGVVVKVWRG